MAITLKPFDRFRCFNFWLEALGKLYHFRLEWALKASKTRIDSCLANTLLVGNYSTKVLVTAVLASKSGRSLRLFL